MAKRRWAPHEDQYLQDHCDDTSIHEIARTLNRSLNAVQTRKTKLGLTGRRRPGTEKCAPAAVARAPSRSRSAGAWGPTPRGRAP